MPEEVRVNAPLGNGERMQVTLGSKSFGLTTKDLLPILLLIFVAILGYYRTVTIDKGLEALAAHQDQLHNDLQHQNTIVHAQTEQLRAELQQQNTLVHDQTAQMRTMLETLNYNLNRPIEERLPLSRPPPPAERRSP